VVSPVCLLRVYDINDDVCVYVLTCIHLIHTYTHIYTSDVRNNVGCCFCLRVRFGE